MIFPRGHHRHRATQPCRAGKASPACPASIGQNERAPGARHGTCPAARALRRGGRPLLHFRAAPWFPDETGPQLYPIAGLERRARRVRDADSLSEDANAALREILFPHWAGREARRSPGPSSDERARNRGSELPTRRKPVWREGLMPDRSNKGDPGHPDVSPAPFVKWTQPEAVFLPRVARCQVRLLLSPSQGVELLRRHTLAREAHSQVAGGLLRCSGSARARA